MTVTDPVDSTEEKNTGDKTESSTSSEVEADITKSIDEKSVTSTPSMTWFHIDFMGSKGSSAEPQGMKAVYEYIKTEILKEQ